MSLMLPMIGPLVSAEHKLPEIHAAEMQLAIRALALRHYVHTVQEQMGDTCPLRLFEIFDRGQSTIPCAYVLAHLDGNGYVASIEYASHDGSKYVNEIRTSEAAPTHFGYRSLEPDDPCSRWRRVIDELHLVEFAGTGLLDLLARRPK